MNWPWTTPEDRVDRDPRDGTRPAPPWPSWSVQYASQFRAPEPERLALAITSLIESGPNESALAELAKRGLARRDIALVLLDANSLSRPAAIDDDRLESDATPSKLAQLCGLCALAVGRDPSPWVCFGVAISELLAIFQGLLDLTDDADPTGGPPPRIAALLRACRTNPVAIDSLLDACAGGYDHPDRWMALLQAATHPAVLEQLGMRRESLVATAREALPSEGAEPGVAFLAALHDSFAELTGALWMRGVMARAMPLPTPAGSSARASVIAAWTSSHKPAPGPARGMCIAFFPMGASIVLVGRWFVEGMIILALAEIGRDDPTAEIAALLERVPEGDARYFPEWTGLPPDCDSLGLLLQLSTWLPSGQRARVDGWVGVCEASLGADKSVPTWFVNGPNGRTTPLDGPFLGDECTGTTLAFLLGALRLDGERFASLFRPNLELVLQRRCEAGSVHYIPEFATHLLLRLVYALQHHPSRQLAQLTSELGLDQLVADRCATLVASQRINGSWGTPQTTALLLEALRPVASRVPMHRAGGLVPPPHPGPRRALGRPSRFISPQENSAEWCHSPPSR